MKNFSIALAAILALTLSTLGTAEAQRKDGRHQAQKQRQTSTQHRAGGRKFQHAAPGRQARQHGRWHNPRRLHRSSKAHWRMKGRHYRAKPGYRRHQRFHRGYQRRFYRGFRQPRRHHRYVRRIYPVYEQSPGHSLGLDIETEGFRFHVNKSE
ncbi:MAG: hypothetical protein GWP69_12665 [Gammaproteobacteria bacterium]|jgi:hypothetical protein|nr:hypothetical protein [Gammaproteobacteria bacterium]NCF81339.1 hypothetical protein [Pseudomonadota bacterium]